MRRPHKPVDDYMVLADGVGGCDWTVWLQVLICVQVRRPHKPVDDYTVLADSEGRWGGNAQFGYKSLFAFR